MYEVNVHIDNYFAFLDEAVSIITRMEAIPRIGEIVRLSNEEDKELERQINVAAKKDKPGCSRYNDCLYSIGRDKFLSIHADIGDYQYVTAVVHYSIPASDSSHRIHIELSDSVISLIERQSSIK